MLLLQSSPPILQMENYTPLHSTHAPSTPRNLTMTPMTRNYSQSSKHSSIGTNIWKVVELRLMLLLTTKIWNISQLLNSLPDAKLDGLNSCPNSTWSSVSDQGNWEQNPMLWLDNGTSTTTGEIATSPWQTQATPDLSSHKNNSLHHSMQHPLQPWLSAMLSSWMLKNSTTTFAPHFPLTPSLQHICQPPLHPIGHLMKVAYFISITKFTSLMLMIFTLKSYNTSMITSSLDISDKTKPWT